METRENESKGLGGKYKYWAFISYSHADENWGAWLHKSLETYRVPRPLVGKNTEQGQVPRRLFPIFRDVDELASAPSLPSEIRQSLEQSKFLIVICSPHSAVSKWVNEEIRAFKTLDREDRIICLLADGDPNATDSPNSGRLEAFAESLRFRVTEDGRISSQRAEEPIAADVRKGSKKDAQLRIIAGMVGLGFDELKQREKQRLFWRNVRLSVLGLMALCALAALSWTREATRIANELANQVAQLETSSSAGSVETSTVLSLTSLQLKSNDFARRALLSGLSQLRMVRVIHTDEAIRDLALLPTGNIVTQDGAFGVHLRKLSGESIYRRTDTGSDNGREGLVATSPAGDLLAISDNNTVAIIDTVSGRERRSIPLPAWPHRAHFTSNGKNIVILTTGESATLHLFSLDSGRAVRERKLADPEASTSLVVSPQDPDRILLVTHHRLEILDATTLETISEASEFMALDAGYTYCRISQDGQFLALGHSGDRPVHIWRMSPDLELYQEIPIPPFSNLQSLEFVDIYRVALILEDGKVLIEDFPNLETWTQLEHESSIYKAKTVRTTELTLFVTTGYDGSISIWDPYSGNRYSHLFHEGLTDLDASDSGDLLVSVSSNGGIRLWDLAYRTSSVEVEPGLISIIPAPDGDRAILLTCVDDIGKDCNNYGKWEISCVDRLTEEFLWKKQFDNKADIAWEMGLDGSWVVFSGLDEKKVYLFKVDTGETTTLEHSSGLETKSFSISPNGQFLGLIDEDSIDIRRVDGMTLVGTVSGLDTYAGVAISPDGKFVLDADAIYDVDSSQVVASLEHKNHVAADQVAFSSSGAFMIDRALGILDVWSGIGEEPRTLEGTFIAFLQGTSQFAYLTEKDDIKIGDVSGSEVAEIDCDPQRTEVSRGQVHEQDCLSIRLSPDGRFAAIDMRRGVSIYSTQDGQLVGQFPIDGEMQYLTDRHYVDWNATRSKMRFVEWKPQDLVQAACSRLASDLGGEERRHYLSTVPWWLPVARPCRGFRALSN